MKSINDNLNEFINIISITASQKETLKKNRDSLRETINNYFADLKLSKPTFCGQGSFSMGTTIRCANNDYDIDDGIYLNHLDGDINKWPSTEKVHTLLAEAVKKHTSQTILDKRKCVRIPYRDGHHVDLAIYGQSNNKYYLAVEGKTQWEENSAKAFKEWFENKSKLFNNNFKGIIKLIKKWTKINGYDNHITGFIITILVGQNYFNDNNLSICLTKTLSKIVNDLSTNGKIIRPVNPYKNLTEKYNAEQFFNNFLKPFDTFYRSMNRTITVSSEEESNNILASLFGTEFPNYERNTDTTKNHATHCFSTSVYPWSNND